MSRDFEAPDPAAGADGFAHPSLATLGPKDEPWNDGEGAGSARELKRSLQPFFGTALDLRNKSEDDNGVVARICKARISLRGFGFATPDPEDRPWDDSGVKGKICIYLKRSRSTTISPAPRQHRGSARPILSPNSLVPCSLPP